MDIKAKAEEIFKKLSADKNILAKFKEDPKGAVKSIADDIPEDALSGIIAAIKTKIEGSAAAAKIADKAGDLADKAKAEGAEAAKGLLDKAKTEGADAAKDILNKAKTEGPDAAKDLLGKAKDLLGKK